jgi:serine/threonine protein kinase
MSRPVLLARVSPEGQKFLGPYLLQEVIGRGGTAVLYRARRSSAAGFEKQVVVKTLLPELAGDPRFLAFFQDEAKLQAQLFHANIAQVQDFGIMRGTPFLELEMLTGCNARELFERVERTRRRVPARIALFILAEACRGLAYAHAFVDEANRLRPIIHRDISLANVMLCRDGSVKLIDFGLASVTLGGAVPIDHFRGKLAYMSPEQIERGQVDRSADVFAFGVVAWELLTGQRLFFGNSDEETLARVRGLEIMRPSKINRDVPRALDAVVMKALARNPAERYGSAGELLAALDRIGGGPASRAELLAYLGGVAPEVFTRTCEACGTPVPYGRECMECCTIVDCEALAPAVPSPPALFVVGPELELATELETLRISSPLRTSVERALASACFVAGELIARACRFTSRWRGVFPLRST